MTNLSKCFRVLFLLAYFSLGLINQGISQTTIQSTMFPDNQGTDGANINAAFSIGQSFTPTTNGNITSISIKLIDTNLNTGDISLQLGMDPGPNAIIPLANPSNATATVTASNQTGIVTFDLSANPFPVTSGTLYRMQFHSKTNTTNASIIKLDMGSPSTYSGGSVHDGFVFTSGFDLNFSITISPPSNSTPIPTLSQWSLLIFGLLVLNVGLVFVRERLIV